MGSSVLDIAGGVTQTEMEEGLVEYPPVTLAEVLVRFKALGKEKTITRETLKLKRNAVSWSRERLTKKPDNQKVVEQLRRDEDALAVVEGLPIVENGYQLTNLPLTEEIESLITFGHEVGLMRERGTGRWVVIATGDLGAVGGVEHPCIISDQDQDRTIHNYVGRFCLVPSDLDVGALGELWGWARRLNQVAERNLIDNQEGVLEFSVSPSQIKEEREKFARDYQDLWIRIVEHIEKVTGLSFEEYLDRNGDERITTADS